LIAFYHAQYSLPLSLPVYYDEHSFVSALTEIIVRNTTLVQQYLEPVLASRDYSVTVRDVDLCTIIREVCKLATKGEYGQGLLGISLITSFLSQQSRFFETSSFRVVLKQRVYPILTFLLSKDESVMTVLTATLLILVWDRFAVMNLRPFSHCLDKLWKGLSSADKAGKTIDILAKLAGHPTFFVHVFVLYDSNPKAKYGRIFQEITKALCEFARDGRNPELQTKAIDVIFRIMSSARSYFIGSPHVNQNSSRKGTGDSEEGM
jgi:hypothetical protein